MSDLLPCPVCGDERHEDCPVCGPLPAPSVPLELPRFAAGVAQCPYLVAGRDRCTCPFCAEDLCVPF